MIRIGILDLQGDVSEHLDMTRRTVEKMGIDAEVVRVRTADEASSVDAIIISGGESTVIGRLMEETGIKDVIVQERKPVMGTCAGMVLLADETDYQQPLLGLIDMKVKRNAFGRQRDSFEDEIDILGRKFHGIFIRAPAVLEVGEGVEVLSELDDMIIAVKDGCNLALAFHPELGEDTWLHEYFIKEVLNCVE
ncbi:pyridoxal 5'-phosphate synthase glutaminase subunit PdxT [Methanothermobacter thermautotrophicus]|uniref:Pyridoxal 5'-phosphate synthase subunit PdxT n=1 Tax=Methanothermobacter thermautotrophicus TaxID=145262 RepID=A0A842YJE1_METTF|nr:pyridoxal 5'-phosphate synthase glutaminase subunit PdxT [Methanothermobacter thermautotrophicus]MBE2899389.1 pyridoxal 5'-phosphate synthase glutaminase subunit PdxT [Methanothermobacter thermautotrophicus]MCQ8904456.1 pyridoxal 5'-phosphate synthase glutaminase subunit PdxT [Methanothermobacter sp.]